jgi:predicted DCC family thiol-disulfide oxidoreductase YuxK
MLVLLYDGLCGFCDRAVQFVLARDPDGSMKFATLQGEFASRILRQYPELQHIDSLVLVDTTDDGLRPPVMVRTAAVLAVARYLGWPWRGALMLQLVPRVLRDWGYDQFARHRHRWFGRHDTCPMPSPERRKRFLP